MEINTGIRRAYVFSDKSKIESPEDYARIEIDLVDWNNAIKYLVNSLFLQNVPRRKKSFDAEYFSEDFHPEAELLVPSGYCASYVRIQIIPKGKILTLSPDKIIANLTAKKLFDWDDEKILKIIDKPETRIVTAESRFNYLF